MLITVCFFSCHANDGGLAKGTDIFQTNSLKVLDQQFVFFKAVKGSKFPYMMKYHPGTSDLESVLFGFMKKDGSVSLITKPSHLSTMTPSRMTVTNTDFGVQVDKKYEGFRQAVFAKGFEKIAKCIMLLQDDAYKGTPLVTEYLAGLPMKIIVQDKKYLRALQEYFSKNFINGNIIPVATNKPLLLLEILDKNGLNTADMSFFETYFTLLDPCNPDVTKFFNSAQNKLAQAMDIAKDAKVVGEKFCESIFNAIEKQVKDFDMSKLILAGTFMLGGVAGKMLFDTAKNKATSLITDPNNKCFNDIKDTMNNVDWKKVSIVSSSFAGALLLTALFLGIDSSDTDDDEVEIVA